MKSFIQKALLSLLIIFIYSTQTFANTKPKVLILHSYHPSFKWTKDINNGINSVFNDITKVDLFVEYMDTKKYFNEKHISILKNMYKQKYKDINFDVIISSDDNAFNFLKKHNKELFNNVPIVFTGVNYFEKEQLNNHKNFTGINEKAGLEENYDLIFKLHPNVENIYSITDTTTTGKIIKKNILSITKKYTNKNVNFHIIDNLTLEGLAQKVQNLPKKSAILFTFYFKTKDNIFLEYYKAIKKIEKVSNTPIYGAWDYTLKHGIIGGYLTSGYFQGEKAAQMAHLVLKGIDISQIPVLIKSPNKYMFDYKQVKKYNINEKDIPYDAIFINKPNTIIELYFKELLTIVIVFSMMIIFIIILLINNKKRTKAEKLAKKQLFFQQNLIDNVNTPIYYKNTNKEFIGCNKAFLEAFKVNKADILHKTVYSLNQKNLEDFIDKKDNELLQNKKLQEYEMSLLFKDGSQKDLRFSKDIFYDNGVLGGIVGTIFDMTQINSLHYDINRLLAVFDTNVIASKTDIDGNIIYVSKAFLGISRFSKEELIGKRHNILNSNLNDKSLYKDLWNTIINKKIWKGDIVNKNKLGQIYTLNTIITPEYDKNGVFLNYTSISQDITAQKLVEKANQKIEVLNKDIVSTQKEIIFRLGALAESRSKETGLHVKRVAKYSKLLALYYGLSEEEAEIIKTASPMHDIGKIAIPDAILNKPARYTPEEFEIMKTHAQIGYDMLKDSDKEILKAASIIAYEHQEKFDGSGYPRGLKGEDIHIYGRITAIADVFDALGSQRVYKNAWSDKEIFKLFENESDKHFDPVLIKIFFDNIDEFLKIRDNMKDIV